MKITVIGTGYVGLVTGTCLADVGNDVLCLDLDPRKIGVLNAGGVPIYEPGLQDMVQANVAASRLAFTTDPVRAARHGNVQFIAVGTPPGEDGSADLQYVLAAARSIAEHMDGERIIVNKSTVPVGTGDRVRATVQATLQALGKDLPFSVVSNPAFLKEGAAIADFMRPDLITAGRKCGSRHRPRASRHRLRPADWIALPLCRLWLRRLMFSEGRQSAGAHRGASWTAVACIACRGRGKRRAKAGAARQDHFATGG